MDKTFKLKTLTPGHKALVWFEYRPDGQSFWMFTITASDGRLVHGNGADHELPLLDQLVAASWQWIDWRVEWQKHEEMRQLDVLRFSNKQVRDFLAPNYAA